MKTIQDLIDKANHKEKLTAWENWRLTFYCVKLMKFYGILFLGLSLICLKWSLYAAVLGNYTTGKKAAIFCIFSLVFGAFCLSIDYGRLKK